MQKYYPIHAKKYPILSKNYTKLAKKYPIAAKKKPIITKNYPITAKKYQILAYMPNSCQNTQFLIKKIRNSWKKCPILTNTFQNLKRN